MHVAKIATKRNGRIYDSFLVRQSYREGDKVMHRTIANLSALPLPAINAIRSVLRGETLTSAQSAFDIQRSLPHGHVLSVLGMVRKLGLDKLIASQPGRERDLVVGMIVNRLLEPASKLATTRLWNTTTLAETLAIVDADEDDLYAALDWLGERQEKIEKKLAARHLMDGGLVLYDLSSTYLEGRHCELAAIGYSRDGRRNTLQIEFGMTTDQVGRPVAVEVFKGNTADPATVASAVDRIRNRFGLQDVVLVGDRGMLTSARIEALKEHGGVAWISSLRSPQIQALVDNGLLQMGLFDVRNLAEITSPDFPGERLVVCKNPLLAKERARKRESLLQDTELELNKIVARTSAGRLTDAGEIGVAVGKVIHGRKVAKHFVREIAEGKFTYQRNQAGIDAEAALDGIYVIRTSVEIDRLAAPDVVISYKRLTEVERAFRGLKSMDMQLRPVHHYLDRRVRAHVFLCMLAYYVQWHLERAWAPLLFRDEEPPLRADPIVPAQRSAAAARKARSGRLPDGTRAHNLRSLLAEMATLTRNRVAPAGMDVVQPFTMLATPTPLQARALTLLELTASSL